MVRSVGEVVIVVVITPYVRGETCRCFGDPKEPGTKLLYLDWVEGDKVSTSLTSHPPPPENESQSLVIVSS